MVKKMALESLHGLMAPGMKVKFMKIKLRGKENLFGPTKKYMLVIGLTIKWREKVCFCGQMGAGMKVTSSTTKNMELG